MMLESKKLASFFFSLRKLDILLVIFKTFVLRVRFCRIYSTLLHMTPGLRVPYYSDIFKDMGIPQPGVDQRSYVLEERYLGLSAYDQENLECLRLILYMMESTPT